MSVTEMVKEGCLVAEPQAVGETKEGRMDHDRARKEPGETKAAKMMRAKTVMAETVQMGMMMEPMAETERVGMVGETMTKKVRVMEAMMQPAEAVMTQAAAETKAMVQPAESAESVMTQAAAKTMVTM